MLALRQKAIRASGRLPLAAAQATRQYSSPPTPPTEEIKQTALKYQDELKRIRAIDDPVAQEKEFGVLRTDYERIWESQKEEILQRVKAKGSEHGHEGHGHEDHGHHHAEPTPESLGTGFFVVLAAVPISLAAYAASRPDKDGNMAGFSKVIDGYSYSHYKEKWMARNTLHTAAVEQAAFNRNLFHSQKGTTHVDLRFPEIFNTGSPHNVVAGQGPRNMDVVVAHYNKLNADEESRKVKAMADKQ